MTTQKGNVMYARNAPCAQHGDVIFKLCKFLELTVHAYYHRQMQQARATNLHAVLGTYLLVLS